ncbi:hypothetical protein J3U21_05380 [Gilliamella sp. B2776]|nr:MULTISPECIES: hypothetical protein [unclassified Gilliamella]MCX8664567.1 hypothetical protein [Gilliamella sp. B2887]MCX8649805.1 hypothetical protein [Gilliamella sp. B2779]MCX8653684.1 hypothetical protein [Gilliamella sp. B2737]MCX8656125.1 hypothetical protein [Gilliamella sp. B2894]MCX8691578.1 hypothetical protein [Gilliamella sp. B2776]
MYLISTSREVKKLSENNMLCPLLIYTTYLETIQVVIDAATPATYHYAGTQYLINICKNAA